MHPGVSFQAEDKVINLDGDNIEDVDRFSCLGDVLSTEGGVQQPFSSTIRSAWRKFKKVLKVKCGKSTSLKVRGTLYKSYVRSASAYGAECWALRVEDKWKLKIAEMRMLRIICEKTLKDKINNEKIREMTGVDSLEEFLKDQKMHWLGHVERMDVETGPVNKTW